MGLHDFKHLSPAECFGVYREQGGPLSRGVPAFGHSGLQDLHPGQGASGIRQLVKTEEATVGQRSPKRLKSWAGSFQTFGVHARVQPRFLLRTVFWYKRAQTGNVDTLFPTNVCVCVCVCVGVGVGVGVGRGRTAGRDTCIKVLLKSKEQSITITASSTPPQDEAERQVQEAETSAASDKNKADNVKSPH